LSTVLPTTLFSVFRVGFFLKNNREKSIFVNEGYNNWKNALGSNSDLKKHHMSYDHKTSHAIWTSYLDIKKAGNVSVASLINDGHLKL